MTDVSDRAREFIDLAFNAANRMGDHRTQETLAHIRDILAGQSVGEGYVLVPRKMTAAMINAWSNGPTVSTDEVAYRTTFQDAWQRVLAATPAPDSPAMVEDVRRLVIAARRALEVSDVIGHSSERRSRLRTLDQAAEAFANCVPWDDEPDDQPTPASHTAPDALRSAMEGLLPHVESARLREEADAMDRKIDRMPVRSAVRKAHEALATPAPSDRGEERIREALNDAIVTMLAVRATAASDEWDESADHLSRICGESIISGNIALNKDTTNG